MSLRTRQPDRPRRTLRISVLTVAVLASMVSVGASPTAQGGQGFPPTLLANGGFEERTGSGPAGWTNTGGGAYSSSVAHSGNSSVSLVAAGSAWRSDPVAPGPAGAYRALSGWFLRPQPANPGDSANLAVSWRDSAGVVLSTTAGMSASEACPDYYYTWAGDWCFTYVGVVVPEGAADAVISAESGGSNLLGTWFVDDIAFGPFVSGPAASASAWHRPSPAPAPGTAAVDVDASSVIRDLPTILAGDNAQYTGALPRHIDSPEVTEGIRATSKPGILRFPGGNFVPFYDWEHPGIKPGCVNVNPVMACATPNDPGPGVTDIDELMRFARASGTEDILWTLNFTGRDEAFTVHYTGTAIGARLSVTPRSLDVALSGEQEDGTKDLRVPFSSSSTIGDVMDVVNATPGYSASFALGEEERLRDPVLDELVVVDGADAKTAPASVSVNTGNIHKALRLIDYANNPNSTVIGPNGTTRDAELAKRGLPPGPYNLRYFEIGNENYLHPAQTGGLNPRQLAGRIAEFAQAMHAAEPGLKVGMPVVSMITEGEDSCCGSGGAQFVFNMVQAEVAGPYIDFVVDHPYEQFHVTYNGMLAHPQHLNRINVVRWHQELFQTYSPDHRPDVDVYFTEFDLLGGTTFIPSAAVSKNQQLVNGLFVADMTGVFMTLGAAQASRWSQFDYPFASNSVRSDGQTTELTVEPAGYGLTMFNQHWGDRLVRADYRSPTYAMPAADATRANIPPGGSGEAFPWQTSYASISNDGRSLYVMLINKSGTDPLVPSDQDMPLITRISLRGFDPKPDAQVWTFNGTGRDAYKTLTLLDANGAALPTANPDAFGITESSFSGATASFDYTTPAHSITVIKLDRRAPSPSARRSSTHRSHP